MNSKQIWIPLLTIIFSLLVRPAFAHHDPKSPAGTLEIEWRTDQIQRTYAVGVFQTLGLRVDNNPVRAGIRMDDGVYILHGIALAFDINDELAFDIDQKVKVHLEIEVSNLKQFYYTYDKNGQVDAVEKIEIPEGSKGWKKFEFILDRARFANRGFGGTDFAISSDKDMSNALLLIKDLHFEIPKSNHPKVENGKLQLTIYKNGTKELIAAQVGLYDATGRMPLPSESAIEMQIFENMTRSVEIREELDQINWQNSNHWSMYVDGFYSSQIPSGKYTLVITKGPEYPIITKEIIIDKDVVNSIKVEMEHVLDMPSKGWYSGDVHNHLSRLNSLTNANQMAHARAADLHMHWLYALGNTVNTYFNQYAWGKEGQYKEKDYYVASGQEDPRTDFLGHMLAMGHNEFIRYPDEYFHYDKVAKEVHKQGGIFGVAHMDFAQFQQKVALALLAPEGEIDFVEIFQYASLHLTDWYAFLNMGFQLPAAAGSDWPYMSLPGSVRTYVHLDGDFTPDAWNQGLKDGKSYVSNGPMLEFNVDDQPIGSTLKAKAGQIVKVKGREYILPSWDKLLYASIIVNGDVVKEIKLENGQEEIELEFDLKIDESSWVAFKVHGEKAQNIVFQTPYTKQIQAHSSPIYILVDGQPAWSRQKAPIIIDKLIVRLESVKEMKYQRNDNEAWESPDRTAELLEIFRPYLKTWIDETIEYYQDRKREIIKAK